MMPLNVTSHERPVKIATIHIFSCLAVATVEWMMCRTFLMSSSRSLIVSFIFNLILCPFLVVLERN